MSEVGGPLFESLGGGVKSCLAGFMDLWLRLLFSGEIGGVLN